MVDCTPTVPERPTLDEPEDCCLNGAVKFYGTSSIVTFDGADLKRTYLGSNAVLPGASSGLMTPHGAYGISDFSSDGFGQAARANVYRTRTFGAGEYSIIGQITLPAVPNREWTGMSMGIYAPGLDLIVLRIRRVTGVGTGEGFLGTIPASLPIGMIQYHVDSYHPTSNRGFSYPAIDGSGIIVAQKMSFGELEAGERWVGTPPYLSSWATEHANGDYSGSFGYFDSSNGQIRSQSIGSRGSAFSCTTVLAALRKYDNIKYKDSEAEVIYNKPDPTDRVDIFKVIGLAGSTMIAYYRNQIYPECSGDYVLYISNDLGANFTENAATTGQVIVSLLHNNGIWAGSNYWTENPSGTWKSVVNGTGGISFSTQPKPW